MVTARPTCLAQRLLPPLAAVTPPETASEFSNRISRCGNGISIPFSRNVSRIALLSSPPAAPKSLTDVHGGIGQRSDTYPSCGFFEDTCILVQNIADDSQCVVNVRVVGNADGKGE